MAWRESPQLNQGQTCVFRYCPRTGYEISCHIRPLVHWPPTYPSPSVTSAVLSDALPGRQTGPLHGACLPARRPPAALSTKHLGWYSRTCSEEPFLPTTSPLCSPPDPKDWVMRAPVYSGGRLQSGLSKEEKLPLKSPEGQNSILSARSEKDFLCL